MLFAGDGNDVLLGGEGADYIDGGDGTDTVTGSATDTQWTVDGDGSGSVGSLSFANVESLVGAADNADVFDIAAGAAAERGRLRRHADAGVRRVWLQQGAESDAAIEAAFLDTLVEDA